MASTKPPPGYVIKNWTTTYDKVAKFTSDTYYTNVNLYGKMFPETATVKSISHYAAPGRITWDEAMLGEYVPANIGQGFGPTWSTHWFRIELEIPVAWLGKQVQFVWQSGSEAMVWINGEPRQGLNSSHSRYAYVVSTNLQELERVQTIYVEMAANHIFGAGDGDQIFPPNPNRYFTLERCMIRTMDKLCYDLVNDFHAMEEYIKTIYVEMAANRLFGAGSPADIFPPNPNLIFTLSRCELRTMDKQVYDLYNDFKMMEGYIQSFGDGSNRGYQALYLANEMVNIVDVNDSSTYQAARDLAASFFAENNGASQHTLCAIGNCHIDTAWLWEYDETKRKCARSWSTSIRLLEMYPQFIFAASQAQQFEWVKDNYPSLFAEIQAFNTQGRFYHVGGTWVEMDGNVPSGEGMVRQFLVGQRFYEQNFGSRCTEFWLPDTFGYSPQLPQIMRLSGITRFVTQKLSWSLVNKFPHNTFKWAGIDGSQVLSHFPPGDSYVMQGRVEEVRNSINNFKDKGRSNTSLYLYGHGDGGQGPDAGMIERLSRMTDVDGIPKVQFSTPRMFFERLESEGTDNLCVWKGELYLELHNGTYTTQAKIKKENRETEFLMSHVEIIGTLAHILDSGATYSYPSTELLRLWKLVLTNHFHDILPGTSIQIAHEAAFGYYDDVKASGGNLLTQAKDAFFAVQNDPSPVPTQVLFNLTSWDRTEVVTIPAASKVKKTSKAKALEQVDKDGNTLVVATAPSLGYSVLVGADVVNNQPTVTPGAGGSFTLDNGLVRADVDASGRLTGLYVGAGARNAIEAGEFGNQFLIFKDTPMYWDAWDIADYHLETQQAITETVTAARIVESGPIRATLEVVLRVSASSTITQYIMLEAGSKYIKFQTEVDWNENHKCLKVEFPISAYSQYATYECQYGFLERPTHFNTSWDWAKYEVFGHKWADYSEYNWGVSIINDSKYGWSCIGNRLRLSLLRSPKSPDPTSDMGIQNFTYGAIPHTGTFQDAGVVEAAWALNVPLQLSTVNMSATVPATQSFVTIDQPSVIAGALKKCEDDDNAFVLRLYEAYGGHITANVSISNLPSGVLTAEICNILEDVESSLPVATDSFSLDFTPFQIQTVKITFRTVSGKK